MASYETEHATDPPKSPGHHPRRPDLSTFFSTLAQITPDADRTRPHAVPVPHDVSAAHINLAEAFTSLRSSADEDSPTAALLEHLISSLRDIAESPPREVQGVSEEYIAGLERVDVKKLGKKAGDCPICGNGFLDDEWPLVVRLPCHRTHVFDLECLRPWLLLRGTCPLDRVDLAKRERERKKKLEEEIKKGGEDEEEEWDGLYG